MTLTVTHAFASAVADDPAAASAGEVLPSHWNASHTLSGTISVTQGGTGTGTAFTTGSVVFADGSGVYTQDNINFFWDDTNHILKVGDSTVSASRVNIINSANNLFLGGSAAGSSLTGGSNNTLVGSWAGTAGSISNVIALSDGAGNLLYDYNYTLASATFINSDLAIATGKRYDIGSGANLRSALFTVLNGASDNWFIGGAGNTTVSGAGNMGMGFQAVSGLTSGTRNIGIGPNVCGGITSGADNISLGGLAACTDGANNIAIGSGALTTTVHDFSNTAVGHFALNVFNTGAANNSRNTAVGKGAGVAVTTGQLNTIIGADAGNVFTTGAQNTIIGCAAAAALGTNASSNIMIGYLAGLSITGGSNNTLVGGWFGPAGTISNVIALSDGAGNLKLDYGFTNAATWTSPAAICVTPVATASLPTAGIAGRRHFVTDATATTFASIVAGSGANKVPVYDDGTNWRIG